MTTRKFHSLLQAIKTDKRGIAIVEFAIIAPALLLIIMGVFDIGHNIYSSTLLEGAIQKAARDSTIEGALGNEVAIDAQVTSVVDQIVPDATITFDRRAYSDFGDIARPEDFVDGNGDGLCNNNESFEDVNGNNTWDSDRGTDGRGGARDAVLYTVTVSYDRLFPMAALLGFSPQLTSTARTVLRNQPYGPQERGVTIGSCI